MNPDVDVLVVGPSGPVNTGEGDQHNYFSINDLHRRRAQNLIDLDHLRELDMMFVEPAGFDRLAGRLAEAGSALLRGPVGSGRRAAAQMLLHRTSRDTPIRSLSDQPDTTGGPILDPEQLAEGHLLLLDLSDSRSPEQALRELPAFRQVAAEVGAHLVVVLPEKRIDDPAGVEASRSAIEMGRPDGRKVFTSHLIVTITQAPADYDEPLGTTLDTCPMRDIATLTDLVRQAQQRAGGRGTIGSWVWQAWEGFNDRAAHVASLIAASDAPQRAMLAAAGLLEGAAAELVAPAAAELLRRTGHPGDERPRLQRPGVSAQFTAIGATVDTAGRVGFVQLGYGNAVLDQFWDDHPDLRADFREWLAGLLPTLRMDDDTRDAVVARFADRALRTGRPRDLIRLAEVWSRHPGSRLLLQARTTVELGLVHPGLGTRFRRQVYDWSGSPQLSSGLAGVLVRSCLDVIAPVYPEQAVVRLHRLARHRDPSVRRAALDALADLLDTDRRLCRGLLDRLRQRLARDAREADTMVFLDLMTPHRLTDRAPARASIADPAVRVALAGCWQAIMSGRSAEEWSAPVRSWLAAAADPGHRGPLLDVLIAAAAADHRAAGRLYVLARDRARAPGPGVRIRQSLASEIAHRLDAAQGIQPWHGAATSFGKGSA
jgi:hypothetical protein